MEPGSIFVGTSGWTYDDWAGTFYPEKVKGAQRLAFYTTKFNTVEINATFYRLPTQNMLDAWNERLPDSFHLVVKGSRVVTHFKKLSDCREPLQLFLDRVGQLKTLRVILWQLPPSLHKDLDRLGRFLGLLPPQFRYAVEFRHQSWWDPAVAELLRRHNVSFVAVSHPKLPEVIDPTTDFLYLRLHGRGPQLYRYDYRDEELNDWAARVKAQLDGRRLYAFFNNDFEANAPRNAERFRSLFGNHPKTD